ELRRLGEGGGVAGEDITVHAVPRADVPAWLMQKYAEGYELDLKLWARRGMIDRNPDGSRPKPPARPRRGPLRAYPAKRSVACTSASTFSASTAEWPEVGGITSSDLGHALCRSQALATGHTTS